MEDKGEDKDESKAGKATLLEIEAAVLALDDSAWLRIRKFADFRAYAGCTWDGEDLLQESLTRIFEGSRNWDKSIDFDVFLHGVIRSIANHKYDEWKKDNEVETQTKYDDTPTPLDTMMDSERCSEILEALKKRFENESNISKVLEGWEEGFTRRETQQYAEISDAEYEKIVKKVDGALTSILKKLKGGKS